MTTNFLGFNEQVGNTSLSLDTAYVSESIPEDSVFTAFHN